MIEANDPFDPQGGVTEYVNALNIPTSFKIHEVDGLTSEKPDIRSDVKNDLAFSTMSMSLEEAMTPVPGELNILEKLQGDFHGTGLNMIFRPSFGNNRRDNLLEYNVTQEVTQFVKDIGDVPNRGLGKQRDVIVRAVPYTQLIKDLLEKDTQMPTRAKPIGIHFENGMFLRTPPTDFRPVVRRGTISRLASIPHGTTINCQGFEPDMSKPIPGKPKFKKISILPFPKGTPDDLETFVDFFPQMDFKKKFNLRIPQEIKEGGPLKPDQMLNPNLVLAEMNDGPHKRIKEHYTFKVHSDPKVSKIPGGGTANIGFLSGPTRQTGGIHNQNQGANADGASVGCQYWISTVEYDVLLPEGDFSGDKKETVVLACEARKREEEAKNDKRVVSPCFSIELDKKIPANTFIKCDATQIQYSQNVTLNFDDMGWPHISVATLSPLQAVPVPASKVVF